MEELQIQYKDVDDLIPYVNNSRTHSDMQVTQIASSIKEFGFTNPILTDGEDGVIAGHGRLLAAKKLGLEQVPVIELHGLDEIKKKAYVIADNKLALNSGWDQELLLLEIENLKLHDFDIDLLGFDNSELIKSDIDYSVLDGQSIDQQIEDMAKGVRKAIQIDFEIEHYDEAFELVKFWREQGAYVGYMVMDFLRKEKEKV